MFLGSLKVLPYKRVHLYVKVIHQKFGDIVLIFRGCPTESTFLYYCDNKRNVFLSNFFWGSLNVSPSKKFHLDVKVIHKKFGDILLIFRGCTTEWKFLYHCDHKKMWFLTKKIGDPWRSYPLKGFICMSKQFT